jgi:hypothetical protein
VSSGREFLIVSIVARGGEFETKQRLKSLKTNYARKWRAQEDDLRAFLSEIVAALPQIELPSGLTL